MSVRTCVVDVCLPKLNFKAGPGRDGSATFTAFDRDKCIDQKRILQDAPGNYLCNSWKYDSPRFKPDRGGFVPPHQLWLLAELRDVCGDLMRSG